MGRKKAEEQVEGEPKPEPSVRDKIFTYLEKTFGKEIILDGSTFLQKPVQEISISPCTDVGMGKLIEGSWVEVSGDAKTGKTLWCLWAASQCQKPENGNRNVYYISAECRVHKRDIASIGDMDPEKLFIVQSTETEILSAQKTLQIVEHILHQDPGCVVIIDSQSALCDEKELASDIGTELRASGHKAFAQFTRKCAPVIPAKKSLVFVIVHIAPNVTGYGGPREKENTQFKFQKDYHIRATKAEDWEDEDGVKIGLKTSWKVITSRTGMRGTEFETMARFGRGLDVVAEIAILIKKYAPVLDGIELSGSHYYFPGFQEGLKCNGEKALRDLLYDSPPLYEFCKAKLDEFIKS